MHMRSPLTPLALTGSMGQTTAQAIPRRDTCHGEVAHVERITRPDVELKRLGRFGA
jgi:hypothetical protein